MRVTTRSGSLRALSRSQVDTRSRSETDRFAHAVAIEADGFVPDDNFFHLEPGEQKRLFLRAENAGQPLHGCVVALNGTGPVPILSVVRRGGLHADRARRRRRDAGGATAFHRARWPLPLRVASPGTAGLRGVAPPWCLCPALWSENSSERYRVWRKLAEQLAANRFRRIRFDYEGTGDSAGDLKEPDRLDAWLQKYRTRRR